MSNAFSYISNPGLLIPETPGIATQNFSRTNPRRPPKALRPWPRRPYARGPEGLTPVAPKALRPWPRRSYDRGLAHHHYRYAYNPTLCPEHYPGHHPRERIGRIDRIWGLILGGVGGSSPIAFPSVLVDHKYQKN